MQSSPPSRQPTSNTEFDMQSARSTPQPFQLGTGEFDPAKINRTWLTLQSCLNEILLNDGGNEYKIPHMNKAKLEREGRLPTVLEVPEAARQHIRQRGSGRATATAAPTATTAAATTVVATTVATAATAAV